MNWFIATVQNLEPNAQVQIVRFPSTERIRVVNEWTSDKSVLLKLLDEGPRGGGGSPIYDGLWTALDQIKDAKMLGDENRFAVVLISACEEGGSLHKRDELLDEFNKTNVPLFTVMLSDQHDRYLNSVPNKEVELDIQDSMKMLRALGVNEIADDLPVAIREVWG